MDGAKRKPRDKPANRPPVKRQKYAQNGFVRSLPHQRQNLTLADWLLVYAYVDAHPDVSQVHVVDHFRTRHEGALVFDQSTLSRKLRERPKMEARANDNPNALSSKRPRVVTRPDVERALVLWVQDTERKGETISGPMLREKRKIFEDKFQVPESERLFGDSWVQSFNKTYKTRDVPRRGEVAPVDMGAVEAEKLRCRQLVASYAPRDRFNMDEAVFNPYASPDRDRATRQPNGGNKETFRISIGVACNADGTEKLDLFFVGKEAKPRCFKKRTPEERGFYYRDHKKARMTSELFEEWMKKLDIRMKQENRHIILLVDSSSGHLLSYEPSNVRVEIFKQNMAPYVQPCDAGIIRCFKALYRRNFSRRAIDLDEAGGSEIYKMELFEAMVLAKEAWNSVTPETIRNCWNHTRIQPESYVTDGISDSLVNFPSSSQPMTPHADPLAWKIVYEFATADLSLPNAEIRLQAHLGSRFIDADWRPALQAIMNAGGDPQAALMAIEPLEQAAMHRPGLEVQIQSLRPKELPQLKSAEDELVQAINTLKSRNRIFGDPPTLDDILDPPEEVEVCETVAFSASEKGEQEIVDAVNHEIAVARGEVVEIDSESDEEDNPQEPCVTRARAIVLCEQLADAVLEYGETEDIMELSKLLRRFRACLRRQELANGKQMTLDKYLTA